MYENPYQTPKAEITYTDPTNGLHPVPATKGVRFANLLLDTVAYIALSFVVGLVMGLLGVAEIFEDETSPAANLFGFAVYLAYYIGMEGMFGRTVGKMITGTKVVDERGQKPSFGKILGRSFARMIPFEAFSFLGEEGRGWHDSLPGTFVVKSR